MTKWIKLNPYDINSYNHELHKLLLRTISWYIVSYQAFMIKVYKWKSIFDIKKRGGTGKCSPLHKRIHICMYIWSFWVWHVCTAVYVLQVAIESLKTMRFSPTAPYSIYFHFAMRLSILLCVSVGIKRTSCEVESCAIIVK